MKEEQIQESIENMNAASEFVVISIVDNDMYVTGHVDEMSNFLSILDEALRKGRQSMDLNDN